MNGTLALSMEIWPFCGGFWALIDMEWHPSVSTWYAELVHSLSVNFSPFAECPCKNTHIGSKNLSNKGGSSIVGNASFQWP